MNFDHDFGYYFPPKKREEETENELAQIVIKTHAFQTGPKFQWNVYLSFHCIKFVQIKYQI